MFNANYLFAEVCVRYGFWRIFGCVSITLSSKSSR